MIRRLARLVVFEWRKLVARRLALVALVLVALVAAISPIAGHVVDMAQAIGTGKPAPSRGFDNAWTTLASGVHSALFFATVIVLVFSGSSVSEEVQLGTLKALFCRPVRRSEVLLAKWIALSVFALVLVAVMTATAGAAARLHGPFADIVNPQYPDYVTQPRAAMIRYTLSALVLVVPGILALVAFGLLFSSAIDHPGYAVGAAIGSYLLLGVASELSKRAEVVLFPHYVGLSLGQLSDIAQQFSGTAKELREGAPFTALVPFLSALAFLGGAGFLIQTREVGD